MVQKSFLVIFKSHKNSLNEVLSRRFTCTLVFLFFCSCGGKLPNEESVNSWAKDVDVYVAGDEGNIATYWKNGVPNHLTSPGSFSHASGIAISGNDLYVSGYKLTDKDSVKSIIVGSSQNTVVVDSGNTGYKQNGTIAGYWKNGKLIKLTDGAVSADGTAISIFGRDIYVSGYECNGQKAAPGSDDLNNSVAKYWKNGVPVILTDGSKVAKATAIAVNDSNVYVVGYEQIGPNHLKEARYWKNGKRINLKIDRNLTHGSDYSEANSVFVVGNDVYIAGTESGLAAYWKNGNPVKLVSRIKQQPGQVEGEVISTASSIVVGGANVFVAGTQDTLASINTVAKYWKNGRPLSLTHAPEDIKSNVSIAISGNDVYLAYSLLDGSDKRTAKIWKNGATMVISNKVTEINSLVVVKHYSK